MSFFFLATLFYMETQQPDGAKCFIPTLPREKTWLSRAAAVTWLRVRELTFGVGYFIPPRRDPASWLVRSELLPAGSGARRRPWEETWEEPRGD